MATLDTQYKNLCLEILKNGIDYFDTSRGVILKQIPHNVFDISMDEGFPLLTTKKIFYKKVIHELIWFLSGSEYLHYLHENGVHIWDKDAENFCYRKGLKYKNRSGRVYGAQWRKWHNLRGNYAYDQIKKLLFNLKHDTMSRRHIVTAWNPAELHNMALPPCHWSFEIIMINHTSFALKWHQRSVDTFLGLPFDIASYAFLGKLIENVTGHTFKRLIGDLSNVHIYESHLDAVHKVINRSCEEFELPKLLIARPMQHLDDVKIEDFILTNYNHFSYIKAEMIPKLKGYA